MIYLYMKEFPDQNQPLNIIFYDSKKGGDFKSMEKLTYNFFLFFIKKIKNIEEN